MNTNKIVLIEKETLNEVVFSKIILSDLKKLDHVLTEIDNIHSKIRTDRDTLLVSIQANDVPKEFEYDNTSKKDEIKNEAELLLEIIDKDDSVKIIVKIFKDNKNDILSVYSLDSLSVYFNLSEESNKNKTLEEMLIFSIRNLSFDNTQIFELINDKANVSTEAFIFTNNLQKIESKKINLQLKRDFIIEMREKYCNLLFESPIQYVPEDFYLATDAHLNENLRVFFDSMSLALSLIFTVDTMKIKNNIIEYKIYGYRNMHKNKNFLEITELTTKNKEFFDIYHWIYEENSNITERIGMARNVLSLFSNGDDIFISNESALPSIKSSFEIYLKENVDKYIEVLNQVVLLLNDLKKQSIEIADSYVKDFKSNFTAIFTFLITTILFNSISSEGIQNIFTEDITHITLAFLMISFLYWYISRKELDRKVKKLEQNYERNKNYYKPILDPGDIERIFNSADYLEKDVEAIEETKSRITKLWLFSIGILFIVVFIIGDSSVLKLIKDYIIAFFK